MLCLEGAEVLGAHFQAKLGMVQQHGAFVLTSTLGDHFVPSEHIRVDSIQQVRCYASGILDLAGKLVRGLPGTVFLDHAHLELSHSLGIVRDCE